MSFNEQLPQWDNVGTEPPAQKKTDGWQTSEKPPAGWLNWLFNKIYLSIKELQTKAVDKSQIPYVFTASSTVANQYSKFISDITEYFEGLQVLVTFPSANTGAASINISNLGYKFLKKVDASGNIVSLVAGDIRVNQPMLFVYNGTEFVSLGYSSADQVNIKDNGDIIAATNVEGALQEVKSQIDTHENAVDPHSQYALDTDLDAHKADNTTAHGIGNKLDKSGGTMSGELNMADNLLTRPYIKDYAEALGTTPATTGAVNFDLTTGNTFSLSPTGAATIGLLNPPATGRVGSFTLMINMPATLYAMTYPASFKWDKGMIPTLVVSKMAVITGFTIDAGTTWHVGAFGTEF